MGLGVRHREGGGGTRVDTYLACSEIKNIKINSFEYESHVIFLVFFYFDILVLRGGGGFIIYTFLCILIVSADQSSNLLAYIIQQYNPTY